MNEVVFILAGILAEILAIILSRICVFAIDNYNINYL
jgi:uncharacterized membrane protein